MRANFPDAVRCPGRVGSRRLYLIAVPCFFPPCLSCSCLVSKKEYNDCLPPLVHTHPKQAFCLALPRASPATYGAATMRARNIPIRFHTTIAVPLTRSGVKQQKITQDGSPPHPSSLLIGFRRRGPATARRAAPPISAC